MRRACAMPLGGRPARALAAAALALTAVPCAAEAAPFGELPFRTVTSSAVCLAPTGVPGGLVRWTPAGAELLDATPAGFVPQASFSLGSLRACPAAALDASGAGVVAGATSGGIRVAIRDPLARAARSSPRRSGGWGAPVTLSTKRVYGAAVAVSARGDVVVAWMEIDAGLTQAQVAVARRSPGAPFGAAQRIPRSSDPESVQVAVTAAGEALLVTADEKAVRIAGAAAGAPFGAPRRLLGRDAFAADPALAMSPDGRVLLAAGSRDSTTLFDREPGGEFVRRPAIRVDSDVALAMRPDGTAIVAFETESGVTVLRRDGPGLFGAPVEVPEQPTPPSTGPFGFGLYSGDGPPIEQAHVRVALGPDGRALVAWPRKETGLQAATVTPAGRSHSVALGSPLRPAAGMTPLPLADGTAVVAWTDQNELGSVPPYAGRLHLAVEGRVAALAPAAPELTVGAPRDRTLRPAQPLVLPVRCSAACDVRAEAAERATAVTASLSRAGTTTLRFGSEGRAVAPGRGPLKVRLRWSAPGAPTASSRTVALRLRRLPSPPLPHLREVRARRSAGGIVDVRWSTDGPALDAYFVVYGTSTRDLDGDREPSIGTARGGTKRRSFHVRLRDAADVRYVTVAVVQPIQGGRPRTVRVRVQ